jgi:hypothetical protein
MQIKKKMIKVMRMKMILKNQILLMIMMVEDLLQKKKPQWLKELVWILLRKIKNLDLNIVELYLISN